MDTARALVFCRIRLADVVRYPNDMDREAPATQGRAVARLARQVEIALAAVDLTLPQYRVLGTLDGGPEASSVLAEKLVVSRPSVTGVVDGLVARGLARSSPL